MQNESEEDKEPHIAQEVNQRENANVGVQVQVKGPRTLCYTTADAAAASAGDAFQTFCFLSFYLGGEEANRTLALQLRKGLGRLVRSSRCFRSTSCHARFSDFRVRRHKTPSRLKGGLSSTVFVQLLMRV